MTHLVTGENNGGRTDALTDFGVGRARNNDTDDNDK